jgi:hypothetical protein
MRKHTIIKSIDGLLCWGTDMLRQFLVGGAVSVCNIVVHAFVTVLVVRVAQRMSARNAEQSFLPLVGVMVSIVVVLMIAHAAEVGVWSLAYLIVGAVPANKSLIYFAFVNYTTLGYGDITPVEDWQLLGPITAMNGVLLFGWSTAVIFEVLRRILRPLSTAPGAER